jgi:hypothetical protein
MTEPTGLSDIAQLLVAGFAAVLVFVVSAETLRKHSTFSGPAVLVLAFCVAGLSAISLMPALCRSTGASAVAKPASNPLVETILLPYAALGLALLVLFVLWLLSRRTGHLLHPRERLERRGRSDPAPRPKDHEDPLHARTDPIPPSLMRYSKWVCTGRTKTWLWLPDSV